MKNIQRAYKENKTVFFTDAGTRNNGKFGYQKTRILSLMRKPDGSFYRVIDVYLGDKTNNEGELAAVTKTITYARDNNIVDYIIFSDSNLAVNWCYDWATKVDRLKPIVKYAKEITKENNVKIEWIKREYNHAGLELEIEYDI